MSRSCGLSGQTGWLRPPCCVSLLPHQLWSLRFQSSAKELSSLLLFVAVAGHHGKFNVEGGNENCSFSFWHSRSQVRLQIRPGVATCHRLSCVQHSSQVLSKPKTFYESMKPGPTNLPAREKPQRGPTVDRDRTNASSSISLQIIVKSCTSPCPTGKPPNSSFTEESWQ